MDYQIYFYCIALSIVLMILFVLINFPYYRISYGAQSKSIVFRTVLLNSLAIVIGWGPVVAFWPDVSLKVLFPVTGIVGALGCVGSRFIYTEIIPRELAESMIEIIERKATGTS